MQRGIKVVSWDSGVAPAGRQIHLNPSNNALIGETNVKLAADALQALNVEKGEVAVLSATPTSTNQNIWIEEMKRCYRSIRRCSWSPSPTVTICRIKLPRSGGSAEIISGPESHCLAVVGGDCCRRAGGEGPGKIGKVYVTGLGLPSEMAGAIKSGASKSFAIWNPIDRATPPPIWPTI